MKVRNIAPCIWVLCVNRHGVRAATSASHSRSAFSAIVTPAFQFNSIPELTTCQPAVITWEYTPVTADDPLDLSLYITNENVAQPPAPSITGPVISGHPKRAWQSSHLSGRDTIVQQQITGEGGIDPSLLEFTWPSVNVTQGWYELEATLPLPGFGEESLSFYVLNGTDTSCFAAAPVSASSSTAGGSTTTQANTSISPGGPSASLVVQSSSHKSNVNRGAIAGGVVGGVFIVLGALILILRRIRHRVVPAPAVDPFAPIHQASVGDVSRRPKAGETVLAFNERSAAAVDESQEAIFAKVARMQEEMHARECQASEGYDKTPDGPARAEEEDARLLPVSSATPHDDHALESHVSLPPPIGEDTVLALDSPVVPAVVESQEAMFLKLARIQEEMRARERQASEGHEEMPDGPARAEGEDVARLLLVSPGTPHDDHVLESASPGRAEMEPNDLDLEQMSTPELARQLRAMAQRVALMEARMQTHGISDERPPDYTAQSTL